MGDPILDAHQVEEHIYLLSGPTPISIRDQMLRGVVVPRRLVACGIINKNSPLLVVGAGAGGATAAITAIEHDVPTLLVEYQQSAFLAQAWARTRLIDPTQYDWALDHWYHGKFPWGPSCRIPLDFNADTGSNLATIWTAILKQHETRPGTLLDVKYGDAVRSLNFMAGPPGLPSLKVEFESGIVQPFGAMIWAAGFGEEDRTIVARPTTPSAPNQILYEGQPFWGPDNFTNLGIRRPTVLISGSGDGALQDYIRVTTRLESASMVYRACQIPQEIIPELQSAEDRAQRGRCWTDNDADEAPYLAELQDIHDQAVGYALSSPSVRNALANILAGAAAPPVELVYRGSLMTGYYGLNRFLVLLIAGFKELYLEAPTLFPNTIISNIVASNQAHSCLQMGPRGPRAAGQYSSDGMLLSHACFGESHDVTLTRSDGTTRTKTFNVIIVRHGRRTPPGPLPSRPRHILPLHLPI